MGRLTMKDYLVLEEESEKQKERLDQKKKTIIGVGSICLFVVLCIAIASPILFRSPYKGTFAYIEGIGISSNIDSIYEWNGEDNKYSLPFRDMKLEIVIDGGNKVLEQKEASNTIQWTEKDTFFIKVHVPWQGEKIKQTGRYAMSDIQTDSDFDENGVPNLNPEMEREYPRELLLAILEYQDLMIECSSNQNRANIGYGLSQGEIEIKAQEFVLDYEVFLSNHLYQGGAVTATEEFFIQLFKENVEPVTSSYNKEEIGDFTIKGAWEKPKVEKDIRKLGDVTEFSDTLIFSKKKNLSKDGKAKQIEIQPIKTDGEGTERYLTVFKHIYGMLTDGMETKQSFSFEKDGEKIELPFTYTGSMDYWNVQYQIKDEEPDYFVIPYVFEAKTVERKKTIKLPVPKEDGSFEGTYSFRWKEDGADTTITVKNAEWNKKELAEAGFKNTLCYELEIQENGKKKELESLHIQEENKEIPLAGLYSTLQYSDLVWDKEETPYLVFSAIMPELLEGRTEWEVSITEAVYRYKEPLKLPLKSR